MTAATARASQSLKSRTQARSPTCVTGAHVLKPSPAALGCTLAGKWSGMGFEPRKIKVGCESQAES